MSLTLVIGGTRSGKSARGEQLAAASGLPVRYVATADAGDPAMVERIAAHVARRPQSWTTVEAGDALGDAVGGAEGACVLLDGVGTWLAGRLHRAGALDGGGVEERVGEAALAEVDRLAAAARDATAPVIVVAEEAGQGLLPVDAGARAWLDLLGAATQRLAAVATHVELVVAGRPLPLGPGAPPPAPATCAATATRTCARATRTTRSTCSPADRRPGCATCCATRSTATSPATRMRPRRPRPSRRCTAASPRRSCSPTAPRRRCGCCRRRFAPRSRPVCSRRSRRPRRRCAHTASPSRACIATPSATSRSTPRPCPTPPTSSSSATRRRRAGRWRRLRRCSRCGARAASSSSTRRSWTSSSASPARSSESASTTSSSCAA